MTLIVYGLKNCDTCRKARKWLDSEGISHQFLDVRADGISAEDVARWAAAVGWETLLNRRGTTWRGLPDSDKDGVDEASAIRLMAEQPALVKRPVFERDGQVIVGFKAAEQVALKG